MGYLKKDVSLQYSDSDRIEHLDLSIFSPFEATNTRIAVIICPGGGYHKLAIEHEGFQFASWLQGKGITGIVLPYKLPAGDKNKPISALEETFLYMRKHSKDYDFDVDKIGVAGFSAGGHLAALYSNLNLSSDILRPKFTILFYPVISMASSRHLATFLNFFGKNFTEKEVLEFSCETKVGVLTPPAIIFANSDDENVSFANSILYYEALRKYDIPAALYIFPEGGHGWGMRKSFVYHSSMLNLLSRWLNNFL